MRNLKCKLQIAKFFIRCSLFVIFVNVSLSTESVVLKNGVSIQGDINEISDSGVTIVFSKSKSTVFFKWDELDENYAKKLFVKLFKKEFDTSKYVMGVEVKRFNSQSVIRGLMIKEYSSKEAVFIKIRGKLIKLNRSYIEYIKPQAINLFDIFSQKEIYVQFLKKFYTKKKGVHKLLFSALNKYNLNIYKLHLLLYLVSKFKTLEIYPVYVSFDKLIENSLIYKDMCIVESLFNKNWNFITFRKLYDMLFFVAIKCNYQKYLSKIEQLKEKTIIAYSLLLYNLHNLYLLSYASQSIKNVGIIVENEFKGSIKFFNIDFERTKKYINDIWNKRNFNFFKIEGCSIKNKEESFYKHWSKLGQNTKYKILTDTFINKYLKVAGKSIIKKFDNLECYLYVVK